MPPPAPEPMPVLPGPAVLVDEPVEAAPLVAPLLLEPDWVCANEADESARSAAVQRTLTFISRLSMVAVNRVAANDVP